MEIAAHLVYELDPDGNQLRVVRYTDYAAERVRTLCPTVQELREQWAVPAQRAEIIQRLEARGISFDELAEATQQPDADPLRPALPPRLQRPAAHPPGAGTAAAHRAQRLF